MLLLNLLTNVIEMEPSAGAIADTVVSAGGATGLRFSELVADIIIEEAREFLPAIELTEQKGVDSGPLEGCGEERLSIEALVLSAHSSLLLHLLFTRDAESRKETTAGRRANRDMCSSNCELAISKLPRQCWWLPIRLLSGFLALHGKVSAAIVMIISLRFS